MEEKSKGKRSVFFDDPAIDQLMTFIMELSAEVSVVFDRLDTVERLLEGKKNISQKDIEEYKPSPEVESARNKRRAEYLKRVFRIHNSEKEQN